MVKHSFPKLAEEVAVARGNVTEALDWMISQNDPNERFSGATSFLNAFALLLGANYMIKAILVSEDQKRKDLANFFIHQILPFSSVEAAISCQGSQQLYTNAAIN